MALPAKFANLSGEWKGTRRVYLHGESGPMKASPSRMTIARTVRNACALLIYTWKYEIDPQEGMLLLAFDEKQNVATAACSDSWHMNEKIMFCTGAIGAGDIIDVRGTYAAPPEPDWGWRIQMSVPDARSLTMAMFNIAPDNTEHVAVRAEYARDP